MDAMDYWRLCDDLNVIQATLLILYKDPSNGNEDYVLDWQPDKRPKGFDAVYSALRGAINAKALSAKVVYSGEMVSYENPDGEIDTDWVKNPVPDWKLTTIKVDDLKKWLLLRGMRPYFFFSQGAEDRDYLDPHNEYYAHKLAATVKAWEAVTGDSKLLGNKTPKQALEKWLREHAIEYGLTKEDGTHNQQGIEQIAKVANWKPEGGASKTPVAVIAPPTTPLKSPANTDFLSDSDILEEFDSPIPL